MRYGSFTCLMAGLPPRMRGKDVELLALLVHHGITPACAGKRKKCRKCRPGLGDHPRMCGEKKFTFDAGKLIPGSPPRMRGKVAGAARRDFLTGITPAYAGKRDRQDQQRAVRGDHPRVCGEKKSGSAATACSSGSPPRMRGKVLSGLATWLPIGITPAYAGKRRKRPEHAVKPWDHPRVCGEKAFPASTRS